MQNNILVSLIERTFNNLQESSLANVCNLKIIVLLKGDNKCIEKYCGTNDVVDLKSEIQSSDHIQASIEAV